MAFKCVVYFVCLCFVLLNNGVKSDEEHSEITKCHNKIDPGPCMGYFPRWFYNATGKNCKEFIYGGCKGNENNFGSKEECETQCLQVKQNEDKLESSHDDQEIPEGPCTTALNESKSLQKILYAILSRGAQLPHISRYTPVCDAGGFYQPVQCTHKHSREICWCVDRWGNKIKHTKKSRTGGESDKLSCS